MMETPSVMSRDTHPQKSTLSMLTALVVGTGVAVLHTACGDPTAIPNPADLVLNVVSGDSQIGVPFEELPDPIVVQVMDTANHRPVFNQVINFRVVEGGGSVFAGVAHTNEAGIAQEYWTLGGPGPQLLEARAVTAEGEKVVFGTFSATAVEPFDSVPAFIECLATDRTWRPYRYCDYGPQWVDSSVTASFRVVNADTVPIPNVFVRFEIDTTVNGTRLQGGNVSPDSTVTDTLGIATVTWTLGPYPGDNRMLVFAYGSGETKTVAAWATGLNNPPPNDTVPAHIRCLMPNSGWRFDGECANGPTPVNSTIPVSFQVVARDSTPLPNILMVFVVDPAALDTLVQDGSVVPDSAFTDSAGVATVNWTIGQYAGRNRLIAHAFGDGVSLTEVVEATGVPDSVPIDSVPALIQCKNYQGIWRTEGLCAYNSVPEGTTFPAHFRVTNIDTIPLANVRIVFEVTHGDGAVAPDSAITDDLGLAMVQWTVGSANVGQQLTARVPLWMLEVSVRVGVYHPSPEKLWWQNASGGDWTRASNWSGDKVPRLGDTVVVNLRGDYTILAEDADTLAMGSFEFGTIDTSTTQTLYIDRTYFRVDGFGALHPSAVLLVDSGGAYGGAGFLFIVGGEAHLIGGSWEHNTSLDSGAFVFTGSQPKSLDGASIVGNGGSMIWRSSDTLLVLQDSAYILLRGANLVLEDTLTIMGGYVTEPLIVDSTSTLVFAANAASATYLQLNGVGAYIGGEVAIETTAEPQPGTVFDLIRLVGGAVMTGTPTLVTSGYTLAVNPEAGVGLRVIKN